MKQLFVRIRKDDRGGLEDVTFFTIFGAAFAVMLAVIVSVGWIGIADISVQNAANAAAREASISRTQQEAEPASAEAAERVLRGNIACTRSSTKLSGNGLHTSLGQSGSVSATVSCTVKLPVLSGIIPGERTLVASATSPIDPYRQR